MCRAKLGSEVNKELSLWQYRAWRAPGTTRTSAEQVPIPRDSKSRSFRRECYGRAVLGEFSLCPGHIGKEQPADIL